MAAASERPGAGHGVGAAGEAAGWAEAAGAKKPAAKTTASAESRNSELLMIISPALSPGKSA